MTDTHKISRWKSFNNNIKIFKLSAKAGYLSSIISGYIEKIGDETERDNYTQKLKNLNTEDRKISGRDGSNENLEHYIVILEQFKQLKSELASIRKKNKELKQKIM
jgi:hypothetical protein